MLSFASEYLTYKLSKHIIGQESAIETIVSAICENLEAFFTGKPLKINNILLMGPTGSGKTEIARNISKILNAPFIRTTMADYTLTGYRGRDPQEIVAVDLKSKITEKHYIGIRDLRNKFLIRKKAIEMYKEIEPSPLKFRIALDFAAISVFAEKEEAVNFILSKYQTRSEVVDAIEEILFIIREVEELQEIEEISFSTFEERPFGIVFIDEIDKILIKERTDGAEFYRPLQQFILTMIEGTVVTHEDGRIDTSHITFILAGAFSQHSPEDFISELKGRLNVKVKIRKLQFEDYLKIATNQRFEIPEIVKDKLVAVEQSALIEMAKLCEEMNEQEYLGARRLKEIFSKVNRAIKWEIQSNDTFPVIINDSFVRWAVLSEIPCKTYIHSVQKGELWEKLKNFPLRKTSRNKTEMKGKVRDFLIKELINKYEKMMEDLDYRLSFMDEEGSFEPQWDLVRILTKRDSKGKLILEYLIEKGVIREIEKNTFEFLVRRLEDREISRIKEMVEIVIEVDPEDSEDDSGNMRLFDESDLWEF